MSKIENTKITISNFRNRVVASCGSINTDELVNLAIKNRFVKKHQLTIKIDTYIDDEIIENELRENTFVSLNSIAEIGTLSLMDVNPLDRSSEPNIRILPKYNADAVFRDGKVFIVKNEPLPSPEEIIEESKNDNS